MLKKYLRCINEEKRPGHEKFCTLNQEYEIVEETDVYYVITDDQDYRHELSKQMDEEGYSYEYWFEVLEK